MLVENLLNVIYNIYDFLWFIEIPKLPPEVHTYVDTFFDYMESACGIVANYVPFDYFVILLGIVVSVDVALVLYKFIMWVLEKIPMLDIDR